MKEPSFEYLVDNLDSVPELAKWNHDAWGRLTPDRSYEDLCKQMAQRANKEKQPLHIVAKIDSKVVGGATLKIQEMSGFPEMNDWLGSVVVSPKYQGNGIASKLSLKICELAKEKGIKKLYLQTEALDGGLYKKIGWSPVKQVESLGDQVLIMVKNL